MITKDIARLIYNCYAEIDSVNKMIEELKEKLNDKGELELKNNWGDSKGLELHIPVLGFVQVGLNITEISTCIKHY